MGINISSLPMVDTQVTSNSFDSCDSMDYSPQAPLSVGFPRQEYWSALHFLLQRDLPNPGIKPASPALSGANHCAPGKPLVPLYITMRTLKKCTLPYVK